MRYFLPDLSVSTIMTFKHQQWVNRTSERHSNTCGSISLQLLTGGLIHFCKDWKWNMLVSALQRRMLEPDLSAPAQHLHPLKFTLGVIRRVQFNQNVPQTTANVQHLKLTVPPAAVQISAWPAPSAHPPHLWCVWNSRYWRRTPSPPGCWDAYTNVTPGAEGTTCHTYTNRLFFFWLIRQNFEAISPLPACWSPACGLPGGPGFSSVQSDGCHPWWRPHVEAWVPPGRDNTVRGVKGYLGCTVYITAVHVIVRVTLFGSSCLTRDTDAFTSISWPQSWGTLGRMGKKKVLAFSFCHIYRHLSDKYYFSIPQRHFERSTGGAAGGWSLSTWESSPMTLRSRVTCCIDSADETDTWSSLSGR